MSSFVYLYRITNAINNKIYIGQTVNPSRRWNDHKWLSKNKQEQYIHRAIAKFGIENFVFEVVATCKSTEDANEIEKLLIRQYDSRIKDNGYNVAPGGEAAWNLGLPREMQPMFGKHHSEESKQKISESNTGKTLPSHTDEWKENMSKIMTGRLNTWSDKMVETRKNNGTYVFSEDHKNKMRNAKIGLNLSDETKDKISKSLSGKQTGTKNSQAKLNWEIVSLIRKEYSEENISQTKLGNKYGVSQDTISSLLRNETWKI